MLKKSAEIMRKGGDISNPQEMAEKMMQGQNGQLPGINMGNMMGMNQGNFGTFGTFGNFMNPGPNGMPQNLPQGSQQNLQQMIENSFFERTYAAQLKELE